MNEEQMKHIANLISQDIEKDKKIERLQAELELYKDNEEYLNDKIDKAIEYIYHWSTQRKFFFNKIDRQLRGKPEFKGDIADLLNILQGSDKE